MSIIGSNILAGASGQAGYNLNNSLRFRASSSAQLTRTFGTPTSGQKWTMSFWIKRGTLSTTQQLFGKGNTSTSPWTLFYFGSDNALNLYEYNTGGTSPNFNLSTNALLRDPSAWYHIVVAVDTTLATAANRQIVYVNGVSQTFSSASYYPQNTVTTWNSSGTNNIGYQPSQQYFDGYMTEINFVDGQQLTPSSFGETSTTTGSWIPKKYTSTYGTNGFYLKFADTSAATAAAIGKDSSGNGNNWTPSGISVTAGITYDAMLDVPTNTSATVANYPTLNPLNSVSLGSGNLQITGSGPGEYHFSTIAIPTTGKYYCEMSATGYNASTIVGWFGVTNSTGTNFSGLLARVSGGGAGFFQNDSYIVNTNIGALNDIFGIAVDRTANTVSIYINNTLQATAPTLAANVDLFFQYETYTSGTGFVNFGQRPFTYTPPSGFVALNTYNLPTPTILQGNKYMDATTYTGNGSTQTITNAGAFKPDLVWNKNRGTASTSHGLFDSVRGTTAYLISNQTIAEANLSGVTSFNSNGFSLGAEWNQSANTFVSWQWQAGQGTTSSNTSGSITSTVSVSTTAGFSVVTYTGTGTAATVGHGLGVAPKMVIVKNRVQGTYGNWNVWHTTLTGSQYLSLNVTDAASSNNNRWNGTVPTSTVFSVGTDSFGNTNKSSDTYVAYCWSEIAGFSKFGSYTGNNSTDGPFVYCGFRPKFVMIKRTDSTGSWFMVDTSRNTYNLTDLSLYANLADAEGASASHCIDILSNGFKCKGVGTNINASGGTYIFMAFAENPFKNANAR